MKRLLLLVLVALSGCVDFDAKYAERLARLADAGADAGTPDAGTLDAGLSDAGSSDAGTDAGTDAGLAPCTAVLCPYASWIGTTGSWTGNTYAATSGIVMASFREVVVSGSRNDGNDFFSHFLVTFADGLATEDNVSRFFASESMAMVGAPADFWLADGRAGRHFLTDGGLLTVTQEQLNGCGEAIWGLSSTSQGLVTTGKRSVCLQQSDGGEAQLCPLVPALEFVYFYSAWATPSGEVLAAGGNFGDGNTVGHLWSMDAGSVAFPPFEDSAGYGFVRLDGVGDELWAATRPGQIMHKPAGAAAFTVVHSANGSLLDLHVASATDVWAVGSDSSHAAHFDGTRWSTLPLPDSDDPQVLWEHVRADDGGLALSGAVFLADAGVAPIVRLYRRGR